MQVSPTVASGHTVQFYASDEYLLEVLAGFAPRVLIATQAHRDGLAARGVDLSQVVVADAQETLATFMADGMPDPERFRAAVRTLIPEHDGPLRAYGEMVDVLWRDGNSAAALRLEELWNEVAAAEQIELLCAYRISGFGSEAHVFDRVCEQHADVRPAETFAGGLDARDIARLQHRAAALEAEVRQRRKLEAELKDFIENATVGMHWVGPDGTILWANDAELALLGYSRDEYVGRPIADFHADPETIDDILRRLGANEEIRDYEARLRAKDGSIRHVAINSNVLFEDGRFIHTRCFTRDITERKRAEETSAFLLDVTTALNGSLDFDSRVEELLSRIVPRLAQWCAVDVVDAKGNTTRAGSAGSPSDDVIEIPLLLGERTAGTLHLGGCNDKALANEVAQRAAFALENARLHQMTEAANRAKDDFLATLSHELRTPLTAVLGWAHMLSLGGLDEATMATAIETIERSARTQAALIDDLLDLSKVVTGKLSVQSELVELTGVVHNAVQTLRLAADAKRIRLEVADSERAIVNGEATRLQQIVWNLLSNAIKFSPPESSVSISVERTDGRAQIVVRDTGRGIAPDFLPHVFEPFRQADGANTRAHGGLGLGLAIVKYLTELHGGTVTAASDGEGCGATFTVTMPLAIRRAAPAAPQCDETVDLTGMSILLVHDDADTRDVVSLYLRRFGAMVHASTGDGAGAALETHKPHVLVSDLGITTTNVPMIRLSAFPVDPVRFARQIAEIR